MSQMSWTAGHPNGRQSRQRKKPREVVSRSSRPRVVNTGIVGRLARVFEKSRSASQVETRATGWKSWLLQSMKLTGEPLELSTSKRKMEGNSNLHRLFLDPFSYSSTLVLVHTRVQPRIPVHQPIGQTDRDLDQATASHDGDLSGTIEVSLSD
jgi:hypothetical protein